MSALIGLQCHLCKATFPAEAIYVCDRCLGPLEPVYDYDAIRLTREEIAGRPKNLWRYRELLPITGEPRTGFHSGFTPLVRCDRLAAAPRRRASCTSRTTRSTIRRCRTRTASSRSPPRAPSSSASRCSPARRPATSPTASRRTPRGSGIECCVFIPDNLEAGKVLGSAIFGPTILAIAGNYDDVNRLCTQVADRLGWGFVNINLRVVLRRRREDARVRDRRAARLAVPAASRVAGRRRHAPAAHRARASASCGRSASSTASCRGSTRRRRPAARRWSTRSRAAPNRSSWCARTRSRSRSRSAIRPTAIRCCRRCARPAAPAPRCPTSRSSTPSGCSPKPKASSPSRPAARRSPGTIDLIQRGVIGPRRIGRRLRHRQRLQDRRSRQRSARRAGPSEPGVQGIRGLVGVAPGAGLIGIDRTRSASSAGSRRQRSCVSAAALRRIQMLALARSRTSSARCRSSPSRCDNGQRAGRGRSGKMSKRSRMGRFRAEAGRFVAVISEPEVTMRWSPGNRRNIEDMRGRSGGGAMRWVSAACSFSWS